MTEETLHWVAFSIFPGIGPVRFRLLYDYFKSAKAAWKASTSELKAINLGDKLTEKFDDFRKHFDPEDYLRQLEKEHVFVLTLNDSHYPKRLKEIPDAPFVLYVKGKKTDTPWDIERAIGVVGTRKITDYGRAVTERITAGLVSHGFTIVSGLAYGVDAVAHQMAIEMGGKTIAVLGCGIDIIAPPSNARLYHQIAEDGVGAVVSEMPLGLRPNKGLFPARNRIISGLSLGVVVTEGADDSGALITARNAAEQGREVFAVPGPITSPYSRGPARLLKNGATLVENVEDILAELGMDAKNSSAIAGQVYQYANEEEKQILEHLSDRNVYLDDIVRATGLATSQVLTTISLLEMKGVIKNFGGNMYGKIN